MRLYNYTMVTAICVLAIQGCSKSQHRPAIDASRETKPLSAEPSARNTPGKPKARGYENAVNSLYERRLPVVDDQSKPSVFSGSGERKLFRDIELEIVWTSPLQFSWNYCVPELHDGKGIYETEYPSTPSFLETKVGAKTVLNLSISDTPYSLYIINGQFSPYFYDGEKDVIWRLNGADLEDVIHSMQSMSVSSKAIRFEAGGGDMAAILVFDFSDRENAPKVKYYERYDGH